MNKKNEKCMPAHFLHLIAFEQNCSALKLHLHCNRTITSIHFLTRVYNSSLTFISELFSRYLGSFVHGNIFSERSSYWRDHHSCTEDLGNVRLLFHCDNRNSGTSQFHSQARHHNLWESASYAEARFAMRYSGRGDLLARILCKVPRRCQDERT